MKKNFVLAAAMCLLAMAVSVSAQKAADFSGKWALDVAKSKLGDRNNIESQTMTITQTATDVKIETATKRTAPPAGGGGGRGGGMGGDMPATYTLGKETTTQQQMGQNTVPVTMGSKWDGSKLVLTRSSTFTGPNGEIKSTTKETWELGADGKTLTVNAERTGMQGTVSTTRVYTKS